MPHGDFRKLSSISIKTRKKWDGNEEKSFVFPKWAQLEPSESCSVSKRNLSEYIWQKELITICLEEETAGKTAWATKRGD